MICGLRPCLRVRLAGHRLQALVGMGARFPEKIVQVSGHRRHAAWPSTCRDVTVRPDQDERLSAFVSELRLRRDDLKVASVEPQRGVTQHAGRVSGRGHQHVPATTQYAVQRGGLPVHADLDVGHALPWPGRAAAAAAVLAD